MKQRTTYPKPNLVQYVQMYTGSTESIFQILTHKLWGTRSIFEKYQPAASWQPDDMYNMYLHTYVHRYILSVLVSFWYNMYDGTYVHKYILYVQVTYVYNMYICTDVHEYILYIQFPVCTTCTFVHMYICTYGYILVHYVHMYICTDVHFCT